MPQIEATLFLVLIFPFINGQSTGNVNAILSSTSEYHFFKPVLSACTSCQISDDKFYTRKVVGGHAPKLQFSITTSDATFDIHLELNEGFIPPGFSVSYLGYDWEPPKTYREESAEEIDNCYYRGYVVGIEDSLVIASTCRGLKGTIYLPGDVLHFELLDDESFRHVLYRKEERTHSSCGNPHHDHETFDHPVEEFKARNVSIRQKRSEDEQKYVELVLVANKDMYENFDTMLDLHEYVKELVNYIDTFYQIIDVRIVLLHLEVWTREDKIPTTIVAGENLENFMAYRSKKIQESANTDSPWKGTDNAHLLFGGGFEGNKLGMASVGTMCTLRSAGVNQYRDTVRNTAATITHEMGHNFGMNHDDGSCSCPENNCIMRASASRTPPETWSDCSVQYLEAGYRNGLGSCLLNELDSSRIFGGPQCGNSIVEADEECDCGMLEDCISQCCNATTCKLHEGALCDVGTCCTEDCLYKDNCNECRSQQNECDITEYCTGQSAHCPGNIHKIDGLECEDGSGVCHSGVCRTRDSQCKDVWNSEATDAGEACYKFLNKFGDWKGNCGKDDAGQYKACVGEDLMCGKLGCAGGHYKPVISSSKQAFIANLKTGECKAVEAKEEVLDTVNGDITYVYEGTKCGDGKICYDYACVDASSVLTVCDKDCHGHGVCNNFGNCHCDAGYAPPDCKNEGHGGSADSGPICANATYERPTRPASEDVPVTEPRNVPVTEPRNVPVTEPNNVPATKAGEVATNQPDVVQNTVTPVEQTALPDDNNVDDEPEVQYVTDPDVQNVTNPSNATDSGGTVNRAGLRALLALLLAIVYLL